jgi:hypothetical protein
MGTNLRFYLLHDYTLEHNNDFPLKNYSFYSRNGRYPTMTSRNGNGGRTVGFRTARTIILH